MEHMCSTGHGINLVHETYILDTALSAFHDKQYVCELDNLTYCTIVEGQRS